MALLKGFVEDIGALRRTYRPTFANSMLLMAAFYATCLVLIWIGIGATLIFANGTATAAGTAPNGMTEELMKILSNPLVILMIGFAISLVGFFAIRHTLRQHTLFFIYNVLTLILFGPFTLFSFFFLLSDLFSGNPSFSLTVHTLFIDCGIALAIWTLVLHGKRDTWRKAPASVPNAETPPRTP